jgi:hypothetical protein
LSGCCRGQRQQNQCRRRKRHLPTIVHDQK